MSKWKLRGPLEKDVQAVILASLGVPQYVMKGRGSAVRMVKSGIYISASGSMWWRANSGGVPAASGRVIMGNPSGTADILGCYRGRLVGLEVKRDSEKQRPSQVQWEKWLLAAGGVYAVVRSPGEAKAVLEGIDDEN